MRPVFSSDKKNCLGDLVCFFILTPLAVISAWLCIVGAVRYKQWENKWEAIGLVMLTCFLIFIYLTWCAVSLKYHIRVFKEWQKKNHIVSLNISNDTNYKRSSIHKKKGSSFNPKNKKNMMSINDDLTQINDTVLSGNNNDANIFKLDTIVFVNGCSRTSINRLMSHEKGLEADQQSDELLNSTQISNDSSLPFVNIV